MLGFILKKGLYLKDWDRIAAESMDFIINNGGVWHLWGHSWEILKLTAIGISWKAYFV
jgi:hypothetical protein